MPRKIDRNSTKIGQACVNQGIIEMRLNRIIIKLHASLPSAAEDQKTN
jgi:hypothetical protein